MMNINKLGDATTNTFAEEESWCFGEKEIEALRRKPYVFSEFSNETVGGRFRKVFIGNEVYRVIKPALEGIRGIKNKSVMEQTIDIISDIGDLIVEMHRRNVDVSRIPPLTAVALGDGSFLIEWIFSKYRIGFVLEERGKESMWYLVSRIEKTNVERFGKLNRTGNKKLLASLVSFVFAYS